jgi:hypothetical protein
MTCWQGRDVRAHTAGASHQFPEQQMQRSQVMVGPSETHSVYAWRVYVGVKKAQWATEAYSGCGHGLCTFHRVTVGGGARQAGGGGGSGGLLVWWNDGGAAPMCKRGAHIMLPYARPYCCHKRGNGMFCERPFHTAVCLAMLLCMAAVPALAGVQQSRAFCALWPHAVLHAVGWCFGVGSGRRSVCCARRRIVR